MIEPLRDRTYRHLFAAQILSLAGTGLATVALGLLAFELAGARAGVVLGTALFIKMVAYVSIAPIVGGFADRLPRRGMLIALDLVRAAMAGALPFVTEIWQIYVLIFALQAASAGFTPTFQATIPDVLPEERVYTRALSLSRLAYDLESLLSPALAAILLLVMPFHALFGGTALGFLASAALILTVALPAPKPAGQGRGGLSRATRGLTIYLRTPRLRGLLALTLAAAAASAFVIVNTVVVVRAGLGRAEADVAVLLAAYGGGSMLAALLLPPLLERRGDRAVTLPGAGLLTAALAAAALAGFAGALGWAAALGLWFVLGLGYSAVLTPAGRLLARSAQEGDRPAVFAAQFALSHGCWLVTYPLAGFLGPAMGMPATLAVMAALSGAGLLTALRLWPADDPLVIAHDHADLPPGHPHLAEGAPAGGTAHAHAFRIDDIHPHWPRPG